MLSESTRQELEAERGRLKGRLSAIDQILAEETQIRRFSASVQTQPSLIPSGNGSHAGNGLRDAIRRILVSTPGGMKPKAVEQRLHATGFVDTANAKTSLITRVRNELWRMQDKKDLRRERGFYSIPHGGG